MRGGTRLALGSWLENDVAAPGSNPTIRAPPPTKAMFNNVCAILGVVYILLLSSVLTIRAPPPLEIPSLRLEESCVAVVYVCDPLKAPTQPVPGIPGSRHESKGQRDIVGTCWVSVSLSPLKASLHASSQALPTAIQQQNG